MGSPHIIGIAGGSGSGKSSLLAYIRETVGKGRITVLSHDAYYRNRPDLTLRERAALNYDHPDSLETELLCEHVDDLLAGRSIACPVYDFEHHLRTDECRTVAPEPVIIVEGILVLAEEGLRSRFDLSVYVDTEDDIRLSRRIRRDIAERGRTVTSVLDQYHMTVRPMHRMFVEPSRSHADVIIPEGGHNEAANRVLVDHIEMTLERHG